MILTTSFYDDMNLKNKKSSFLKFQLIQIFHFRIFLSVFCKIMCKPMGNFAKNFNLGNRVRPPLEILKILRVPSVHHQGVCL